MRALAYMIEHWGVAADVAHALRRVIDLGWACSTASAVGSGWEASLQITYQFG